ncbi:CU044_2847 family protein [Streptomyces bauhiniae]|uniref:CU044_2847 family protein n=1 Tax=Streptomyces bauhiniae TaxID=2340725 RepID=UPI0038116943
MNGDATRVARIELPDGTPVWARISGAQELAYAEELSYTDTGFHDRVEASVESLHALITGVARSLAGPLSAVRPDEVSVEFGIELTAKAGKVVGLLADGEAKAALTVTLTWNGGPPEPGPVPSGSGSGPVPVGGGGPEAGPTGTAPGAGPLPGGPAPGAGPGPTAPGAGTGPALRAPVPDLRSGSGRTPDAEPVRGDAVAAVRTASPASAAGPEPALLPTPDGPAPGAHPEPDPHPSPPQASAPEPSPTPRPEALLGVWGHPG